MMEEIWKNQWILLHSDDRFYTGLSIWISYKFVILHKGVDHCTWTRWSGHTRVHMHMLTYMPWKCTHVWHGWHACLVELMGDLYRMYNTAMKHIIPAKQTDDVIITTSVYLSFVSIIFCRSYNASVIIWHGQKHIYCDCLNKNHHTYNLRFQFYSFSDLYNMLG